MSDFVLFNINNYCNQRQITIHHLPTEQKTGPARKFLCSKGIHEKIFNSFCVKPDQLEKRKVPVILRFCDMFIEYILSTCETIANKNSFVIPMDLIQRHLAVMSATLLKQLQENTLPSQSEVIQKTRGLPLDLWRPCFDRAVEISADIFKSKNAVFPPSRNDFEKSQHNTWVLKKGSMEKIYEFWMNAKYQRIGYEQNTVPLAFTAQDYQKFQIAPGVELIRLARTMICSEFALYKIREMRAKEAIFYSNTHLDITDLLPLLIEWGYIGVSDPQENDLVLYLDNGTPKHVGRYMQSRKVESKLGSIATYHQHNIFDVPSSYGNEVIFLRKSSS